MKVYEIGTGYTSIPAKMGAATEIVVEELAKAFNELGLDVSIIDIETYDREKYNLPIIEVKMPRVFLNTDTTLGLKHKLKRVIYSIQLACKLRGLIKDNSDRIVLHFHNQYNLFFFLILTSKKLKDKCQIAYTNHSFIWHGDWNQISSTVRRKYFQEIFAMKRADIVYVLNEHTVETLINHVGVSKKSIHLINNGVNIDIYRPLSFTEIITWKKELGFEGKKVFLQIGSVCDRKNQLGALELLTDLLVSDQSAVFAYAGGIISSEYQSIIGDYAKEHGLSDRVIYLGELQPGELLNKYYNIAEALVFPSKSEGFSLVIIEAMAAGIPVIINNALQFRLSSQCLRFADKADFDRILQESILDENRRAEISKNVRSAIVSNYSWISVAKEYLKDWI